MNGFYFNFVEDQNAGTTDTFGFNDFEKFNLTILGGFFWKAAAQSMATEAFNWAITLAKELGWQFHFFKRNRNKCKTCSL